MVWYSKGNAILLLNWKVFAGKLKSNHWMGNASVNVVSKMLSMGGSVFRASFPFEYQIEIWDNCMATGVVFLMSITSCLEWYQAEVYYVKPSENIVSKHQHSLDLFDPLLYIQNECLNTEVWVFD